MRGANNSRGHDERIYVVKDVFSPISQFLCSPVWLSRIQMQVGQTKYLLGVCGGIALLWQGLKHIHICF